MDLEKVQDELVGLEALMDVSGIDLTRRLARPGSTT